MRIAIAIGAALLITLSSSCASYGTDAPAQAAYAVPSGAIVLQVAVQSVEFTDLHPECGADCIPFYYWYKYNAQVKRVVSGEWDAENVQFTHLQHGQYVSMVTDDCYVVLVPAASELQDAVGVKYVADRILSRKFKQDLPVIRQIANDT